MKDLLGAFFFDRTVNGNLIGEFINNQSDFVIPETAFPSKPTLDFKGDYYSNWFDTEIHHASLKIDQIQGTNKYVLEWVEVGKKNYEGEGFLLNDKLIGFYKMK